MDCRWNKNKNAAGSFLLISSLLALFAVTSVGNAAEPVCAQVKVEIRQELTLERQAFDAMMRINNGLDTLAVENVAVTVNFTDENGIPVLATSNPNETNPAAKFFIRIDTMDGISDVSGTGSVAPGTSGEIHWLIIPVPGAAEGLPGGKLYYVGAHLTYTIGGVEEAVDVTPDFITVKPMPQLMLDYFLTSEVIADDAFTPEIELPEPFTLGVRIHNKGTGPANKVAIDSAQPKIVENEQGLLIGFTITGSSLDDQPATPELKINFGDIAPDSSKMGRWIMESTLSGKFTEFSASISHSDELGGAVTSLIDPNDVNTHFLLRDVRVDLPGRDAVRDFLAYPVNGTVDTLTVYESDTADSTVSNLSASATLTLTSNTGTDSYYTLSLPAQTGPFYVRIADPFGGRKVIKDVVRSDGKVLSPDNAWNSKTRNRNTNPPSWEYWLNLFDASSTGSYVVHIGDADLAQVPPVLQFIDDKVTAEGLQVGFMVVASDLNGDPITLTATPLPTGAQFVDNGDGTAYFNWTPAVGQAGLYAINFKASDGSLNTSRSVSIKVNPAWDTDGDGLDDAWELDNFGDLSHDGTADSDGDGVSDLDEYLNGTDPNLPPPAVPTGMLVFSGNSQSTITWPVVNGATGYRIYWSEQPSVTKTNGTLIEAAGSPYTHSGLVNGTTYYYVMSSVGPGGESNASMEFSVIPGKFDWGIPGLVEQTGGNVTDMDAAVAADGSAVMIWAQSDGVHTNLWGTRNLPGSGWDTPVLIDTTDTADVSLPRLAVDSNGYAMALWRESDGLTAQLMVADFSPVVGWGTPSVLSSAVTIGDARMVIRNDGSVVTVWSQGDTAGMNGTVWSNSYVAGAWGSAQRIESGNAVNTASLQLAANASGNLLTVWSATADGQFYDIVANTYDMATGWNTEQSLRSGLFGDATMSVVTPKLAMNSAGQAVLVWNEAASPNSIWANTYDAAAGWATATLLDTSDTLGAYMPVVAIDGTGNALAAWIQSDGTTDQLYSSRFSIGSGWEAIPAIQNIASRPSHPGNTSVPALAMDTEGNVVLAWQQSDGVETNIWARRYERSSASWLTPRIIETENAGDAITPLVVMNTAGDTLVAWRQNDGQDDSLWSNGFASGKEGMPNILPVVVVSDIIADEQTAVSLVIDDVFDQDGTIASYAWSQVSGTSVVLTGANAENATFTAPTLISSETLVFMVNVTDDLGGSTEKMLNVSVNPVNALPAANAGADQSVDEQSTVSLIGATSDSDGSITSTQWTQVSGTLVTLSGADTLSAGFVSPVVKVAEQLVFRLTVVDNEGGVTFDEVVVTVNPVNNPPLVSAGADQTVDEQTAVTLAGTATDPDVDGVIMTTIWSQVSGIPVVLSNANTLTAGFTAPTLKQAATLTFRLTVTDDEGGISSADVNITVNPVNHPPVVNAGTDQTVDEQSAVMLSATATDPDADGVVVSTTWSQTSGTAVVMSNANTLNAGFTAPTLKQATVLTFRLTATDDEGGVTSADVSVTVNPVNTPPVVNAGVDQTVDEQTPVTLSGTATDPDADGMIASTVWSQIAGTPVTLSNTNTLNAGFTAPMLKQTAVLVFRLTATDDEGGVTIDDVQVTVNTVNTPPVVSAGVDQTVDEQTPVTLSGTATDPDADGVIASTVWSQIAGTPVVLNNANTLNAGFTAPILKQSAILVFRLTVTDDEGGVTSADVNITVNPVNHPPVVSAGLDQTVDEQTAVSLSGTASDPDADGVIATTVWTQLSGTPVVLNNANTLNAGFTAPTLKQATVLVFRLTATDDEGGVTSADVSITVNPVNHPPVVSAGPDQTVDEQTAVSLSGTASDPDADGVIATTVWSQIAGTPVTLNNANTLNADFAAPTLKQAATLVFRLTATDDEGGVTSADVSVTVNPVNTPPVVNAGTDQTVDEQTPITLSGTATDPDTDGVIASTVWSQIAGTPVVLNNSNTLNSDFTAPTLKQAAVLLFRLTVTDDEGGVTVDDVQVTVNPVNHPPVVDAGIDVSIAENTQHTLHAQASDPDVDGVIASYQWSQIGGPAVTLNNASTADADFTAPAVYQDTQLSFQIDVVDDEGGTATDTIVVTVFSTNPDDDGDGMDDLWEIQYFGDLSHDGTADTDGDGATDLMEFEFGTDPLVPQGPGEPAIDTPDGTEVTTLQPQLILSNGAHHPSFVVTYQFEIYSDPAMTQLVTRASSVSEGQGATTWTVDQPLQDNTWYYWRGRADGWVLFSSWVSSSFFVNTVNDPPSAFNISSPRDGVWIDTFTPLLSVTNSSDVDGDILTYGFELFRYGDTSGVPVAAVSGIAEGANGTTEWLLDTPLSENEWYTWRSIVTDEHGAQTMSNEASIFVNTVNDAPTSPTPQTPADGSEITTLDTELVTGNATDPDSTGLTYTFELDTVNTFDSSELQVANNLPEGTASTRWYVSGLRDNTWYYWRVKASDGMAESAWKVARFFVNTANDAPTIPVHENPGDNAWVGTLSPTLSVYPSIDVDNDKLSYTFEIYSADRRKRIGSLVASGSSDTVFWQVTQALSESGWYYWRAQAIDEHGAESGWSDTVIFYADSDGINDVPVINVKKLHNDERGHQDKERNHRNAKCRESDEGRRNTRHDACEYRKYTTIRWSDSDPDSNATIRLYVDTDNRGEDGTLIADNIQEDPDGKRDSYRWDITDLAPGVYFIYAEINDGTSRVVSYSPNALIVGDGGGHPYIELQAGEEQSDRNARNLSIQWDDLDSDSNASIALYYASDNQGTNSVLIADGIAEDPDGRHDRYQWDMRSLAAGTYTLYAVISDEKEQLTVYAPYTITIRQPDAHGDEHDNGYGRDKKEKDLWLMILQWIDEHL